MDIRKRIRLGNTLEKKGYIDVNGIRFRYQNGLVYSSREIKGFESPMTFDTFTHMYLEGIGLSA